MEEQRLSTLARLAGGTLLGGDRTIRRISLDSRDVEGDCLFLAVKGENTDGHKYLQGAAENGAAAVMVHQDIGAFPLPVIRVDNTEQALLRMAAGYRDGFTLPVVAVTGSVGKTTTKDMAAAVLGAKYNTLKTAGNQNNQFGMPQTLLRLAKDTQAAVIEMGMTGLHEIEPLSLAAKPDTAIITNVGVSHLEQLGTRENIRRAKLEVLCGLRPRGALVLNGDNDMLAAVGEETWPHILRCSLRDPRADFFAADCKDDGRALSFILVHGGENVPVVLPLSGEHHVMDALLALAAGSCHGVSLAEGAAALAQLHPSGLRQKRLEVRGIQLVADCYNANPDSMRASLLAFAKLPTQGRRIAVLGDMLELGRIAEESHREAGRLCAETGVGLLLCLGKESRRMAEEAGKHGLDARHFTGAEELVKTLRAEAAPGDAVLFKASHSMGFEKLIEQFQE